MRPVINVNVAKAVSIYYTRISLGGQEIRDIFGIKSGATVTRLKKEVIKYFADKDINPVHSLTNRLDTARAYEAWGLDIEELEKRFKKIQKYNLVS